MKEKTVLKVASVVFAAGTAVHLWRLLAGFDIIIGDWVIPSVASMIVIPVAAYMAYQSYTLSK